VPCGYDLESCAAVHRAQKLGLHPTETVAGRNGIPRPVQWGGGRCLVCKRANKLSQAIKGGRIDYYCHACRDKTAAWQAQIRVEIAVILPDCITPARQRAPKRTLVDAEDLRALMLSGIPPMSMKLAGLEMAGMGTSEALDELKVRRENRHRVIAGRASVSMQNRR
jgi:hypothetical protein